MLKRFNPQFSIVIPFGQNGLQLEDTLASVLRYRTERTQVIVVHDGSYQDPYGLTDEVDFIVGAADLNLGTQVGLALRHSSSEFFGIIRPGVALNENWEHAIEDAFVDQTIASVTPLIVRDSKPNRIVVAGVKTGRAFKRQLIGLETKIGRKSRRLAPLGPSSWGAFYRRDAFDMLSTPDSQLDSVYFDLDVALGLEQLGFRNQLSHDWLLTTELTDMIREEEKIAHGNASARAVVRHGTGSANTWDSMFELMGSPFKPWLVKHVFGKFSAKRMRDVDENYRRRLEEKASQRQTLSLESEEAFLPARRAA